MCCFRRMLGFGECFIATEIDLLISKRFADNFGHTEVESIDVVVTDRPAEPRSTAEAWTEQF